MNKHRLIMFLYFFIYVSISFFFSPFLVTVKGFEQASMGYLTTLGLVLLIPSYFLFGYVADRFTSNKFVIFTNLIISFFVFIGLITTDNNFILSVLYILSWTSFIMLTPIIDGLVLKDVNPDKYNKVRAFGSLGAAVSYFVNSTILSSLDYSILLGINAILILIMIVIVININEYDQEKETKNYRQAFLHIWGNKNILLILLITFLTYGTLSADDAYQVAYSAQVVKVSALVIGIVGFLSIFTEASFMGIYSRVVNKIGMLNILYLTSITLFLIYLSKFTLYMYPLIINIGSIAMGVFVGFFVPSAIAIINQNSPQEIKNSILSCYQMAIRLGGILIGFITAVFYDQTGSLVNIYMLHTFIIGIAVIMLFIFGRRLNTKY